MKIISLIFVIAFAVFCFYGLTSMEQRENTKLPRKIAFVLCVIYLFFSFVLFYRFINRLDYKEGFVKGYDKCISDIKSSLKADQITEEKEEEQTYIINKNTKKFHKPTCASVSQMNEENKIERTTTRSELIEKGYSPCQRCHP